MDNIIQHMREAGRPVLDYQDWSVYSSTAPDLLRSIDTISKQVWRIRTHSTRELGARAVELTAPLTAVRAQLEAPHAEEALLQAARTVWAVRQTLLAFMRAHRL
ncbi:hypothetical protein GO986_01480 [Deinococcus sp. HMF7620]|uniref:Uncharacterized protein n=1 Tax=Deinococcus arboris TaxID=2682977 RepID=A0A7C9HXK3_9DEIO|nr:hypothetical protein [Deinococcus arboris]MVN85435.1 hypothetical protein [Deinococcus arboris]